MNAGSVNAREKESDGGRDAGPGETSPWEWGVAGLGLALVLAMLGYLVWHGLRHEPRPPAIIVEASDPAPSGQGYVAPFRVENRSSVTAAGLHIRGELRDGQSVVETSEAVIDYAPGLSERSGGLIFMRDPAAYELRVFAVGYSDP